MHTIRANLYWEFQFVLGYIAVPRSRILLEPLYGSGVDGRDLIILFLLYGRDLIILPG